MGLVLDRKRLVIVAAALAGLAAAAFWFLEPGRMLDRSWNGLIGAVEARKSATVRGYLADDYADRWAYTADAIASDARYAFQHFQLLEIDAGDVTIRRLGDRATLTALIKIETQGTPLAADAATRVNALAAPFVFEWRREPKFPRPWKLVRFDHPELELASFRQRLGTGFLSL